MKGYGLRAAVCVCLATWWSTSVSMAATGVPAWETSFRPDLTGSGTQTPLAARELADGSRMVVVNDNYYDFAAIRYDGTGNVLSTARFAPAYNTTLTVFDIGAIPVLAPVAIDAFGGVFVGAIAGLSSAPFYSRGNAWFDKFDGLTGEELWPAPAVWTSPTDWLAAPQGLFVDANGDLVVSVMARNLGGALPLNATLKYSGADGSLSWGPAILDQVQDVAAAIDGAGNVFVAVGMPGPNAAIKYAGSTGAVLWGPVSYGTGGDSPRAATVTPAGDFAVADFLDSPDGLRVELFDGQSGAPRWNPSSWTAPAGTSSATPLDIAVSPSGDLFLLGGLQANGGDTLVLLAFAGASGNLAWGPRVEAIPQIFPADLRTFGNGDALLTFYDSASPDNKIVAARYSGGDGDPVWGPVVLDAAYDRDRPPVTFVTSSGDVLLAAGHYEEPEFDTVVLERGGADGSVIWGPVSFTGLARGRALVHDLTAGPDGNVVVTGPAWTWPEGLQWATVKYDASTGNTLWGPVFLATGSPGGLNPYQVLADAASNAIVAGYRDTETDSGLAVVKYAAATGAQLWVSPIVSGFHPRGLALDAAGDAFVVAEFYTGTEYDAALVKLSGATGQVIWGPISYGVGPDALVANLAVDASGNVVVAGSSYDPMEGTQDWFTVKASGATGAVLWGPVLYEGVFQTPSRMALDSAGNPILTGTSDFQLMTIKYSGANGAALWGPVFYASPADSAGGFWIAVDAAGDAVVTGYTYKEVGGVLDSDTVTIKYSGANGATLWGPVLFDGAAGLDDFPYAVELDAAGNPVVGGTSEASPGAFRAATLKYDGATGAALGSPAFSWPAGDTEVNGLAVRAGRVFIGGEVARGFRTTALVETLGIETMPEDLPPAECGASLDFPLVAKNGTPGYSWSVTSGALPQGVSLESDGSLAGTPAEEGVFSFRAEVEDSASATAARDFTLVVIGGAQVPILAQAGQACAVTLSVAGSWAGYEWLPGGETTATITVTPLETTTYGLLLSDGSGCATRGSITLIGTALADGDCLAPSIASVTPSSGSPDGGTSVAIAGGNFQAGASVWFGPAAASEIVWNGPTEIEAMTPALSPGAVYDVLVRNEDSGTAVLVQAWTTDFLDVAPSDPFHDAILTVLREGITSGCGAGNYCPLASVTRAQMAVFLVKAKFGSAYQPPAASGTVFADVPADAFAAAYIEQLAALGVTGGCGGGNYCPHAPVTRAQMAVFLLKTSLGEAYVPPPATGVFGDVPVGSFAADWIEDLYARGVTAGCNLVPLLYCPGSPNTRGQVAVFLVRTFEL